MERTAVITGASRGIGRAIVQELCDMGMKVALLDVDGKRLRQEASELEAKAFGRVLPVEVDLSDAAQVEHACQTVREAFGTVDTLVNVAGVALGTPFEQVTPEEWDKVFAINLKADFLLAQAFIGDMVQKGFGRIVSISSMAGVMGSENAGCHYCASKAGVIGLMKHLSKRYARNGVTANAIAPGPIDTEMVRGLGEKTYQNLLDSMPTHRLGTSEQIAAITRLLVSEVGGFVTGTVIEASGGQLIV